MSNSDVPVKEIGELMDMMSSKLPTLIKEMYEILYSEEGATTMSKAIATFYSTRPYGCFLISFKINKAMHSDLNRDYFLLFCAI